MQRAAAEVEGAAGRAGIKARNKVLDRADAAHILQRQIEHAHACEVACPALEAPVERYTSTRGQQLVVSVLSVFIC